MTKTEAIEILQPFRDAMVDQHGCPISDAVCALDVAIETLKQPEQQWVPVTATELLPLSEDEVIVSIRDEMIDGSKFDYTSHGWLTTEKEYWIVDNEINNYVVAWMPMPEPWQGENNEKSM